MKRRFVIGAEGLTKDAERKMVEFFREKKLAWWHHISNFWLVYDVSDTITAQELRDAIVKLRPTGNPVLVLQIPQSSTWSGMRPSTKTDMFDWIEKSWVTD